MFLIYSFLDISTDLHSNQLRPEAFSFFDPSRFFQSDRKWLNFFSDLQFGSSQLWFSGLRVLSLLRNILFTPGGGGPDSGNDHLLNCLALVLPLSCILEWLPPTSSTTLFTQTHFSSLLLTGVLNGVLKSKQQWNHVSWRKNAQHSNLYSAKCRYLIYMFIVFYISCSFYSREKEANIFSIFMFMKVANYSTIINMHPLLITEIKWKEK